jgi:Holliday junction resolvase RusA-like endonuclease
MIAERDILRFTMHGQPVAKARHRYSNGRTYTPDKTRFTEKAMGTHARIAMGAREPFEGPVEMAVVFRIAPAKSRSKKWRREHAGEPHTQKPDADNLMKLVKDALNGIAYVDDSQVATSWATKVWAEGESGSTEVVVRRLS